MLSDPLWTTWFQNNNKNHQKSRLNHTWMCQVQTLVSNLLPWNERMARAIPPTMTWSKRAIPPNTTLEYNLSNAFCEGAATRTRTGYKNLFVCSRLCHSNLEGWIQSPLSKGMTDVNSAKIYNAEQPTTKQQSKQSTNEAIIREIKQQIHDQSINQPTNKSTNQWNRLKPPNQSRKCQTNQGDIMKHIISKSNQFNQSIAQHCCLQQAKHNS